MATSQQLIDWTIVIVLAAAWIGCAFLLVRSCKSSIHAHYARVKRCFTRWWP